MTKGFIRFQFDTPQIPGAKRPDAPLPMPIEELEETSFQSHPTQTVDKVAHAKIAHFEIDSLVSRQLGIEKIQKEEVEARIQKELERRWQLLKEKAEVEGYTAGLEEGKKLAYQAELPRIQEKVLRMDNFLQECDKLREKIFTANESFLMDIIAQVARQVILKELETDQEYLKRVVLALLTQLGTKEDIKIFVSEADSKNIEALQQAVGKEFGKLNNTVYEVSPDVNAGGCKIETRFGVVDANLQTQIENVMKALRN